jgi:hypothetical protein
MGVMACGSIGCQNILCDRYSDDYGYICDECFAELVVSWSIDIAAFMGRESPCGVDPTEEWYEKIFPVIDPH